MQTLAGVTTGGFVLGGILYRVPADSHSGGIAGFYVAYTGLIKRETTKAIPVRCQFRGGVRAVRCLYRLCPRLYRENQ